MTSASRTPLGRASVQDGALAQHGDAPTRRNETLGLHYEETVALPADAKTVFAFADDHANLSGHMNKSNAMMMGSRLWTKIDQGRGQAIGSHIRMGGRVMGVPVDLDEVVIERVAPEHKAWETAGEPRLIVIGPYRMAFDIRAREGSSELRVSIDYALPRKNAWLGRLFGATYARWCVRQMTADVKARFGPAGAG